MFCATYLSLLPLQAPAHKLKHEAKSNRVFHCSTSWKTILGTKLIFFDKITPRSYAVLGAYL